MRFVSTVDAFSRSITQMTHLSYYGRHHKANSNRTNEEINIWTGKKELKTKMHSIGGFSTVEK